MHAGHNRGSIDEGFSGRIKNIEEKLKGTASTEKKPKDLLRAIGKCIPLLIFFFFCDFNEIVNWMCFFICLLR